MAAPDQTTFWNQAAGTKTFTHPLDHARFTNAVSRDARILDFGCGQGRPLQTDARNLRATRSFHKNGAGMDRSA